MRDLSEKKRKDDLCMCAPGHTVTSVDAAVPCRASIMVKHQTLTLCVRPWATSDQ